MDARNRFSIRVLELCGPDGFDKINSNDDIRETCAKAVQECLKTLQSKELLERLEVEGCADDEIGPLVQNPGVPVSKSVANVEVGPLVQKPGVSVSNSRKVFPGETRLDAALQSPNKRKYRPVICDRTDLDSIKRRKYDDCGRRCVPTETRFGRTRVPIELLPKVFNHHRSVFESDSQSDSDSDSEFIFPVVCNLSDNCDVSGDEQAPDADSQLSRPNNVGEIHPQETCTDNPDEKPLGEIAESASDESDYHSEGSFEDLSDNFSEPDTEIWLDKEPPVDTPRGNSLVLGPELGLKGQIIQWSKLEGLPKRKDQKFIRGFPDYPQGLNPCIKSLVPDLSYLYPHPANVQPTLGRNGEIMKIKQWSDWEASFGKAMKPIYPDLIIARSGSNHFECPSCGEAHHTDRNHVLDHCLTSGCYNGLEYQGAMCQACKAYYPTEEELTEKHRCQKCRKCPKVFAGTMRLLAHETSCFYKGHYECRHCKVVFAKEWDRKKHYKHCTKNQKRKAKAEVTGTRTVRKIFSSRMLKHDGRDSPSFTYKRPQIMIMDRVSGPAPSLGHTLDWSQYSCHLCQIWLKLAMQLSPTALTADDVKPDYYYYGKHQQARDQVTVFTRRQIAGPDRQALKDWILALAQHDGNGAMVFRRRTGYSLHKSSWVDLGKEILRVFKRMGIKKTLDDILIIFLESTDDDEWPRKIIATKYDGITYDYAVIETSLGQMIKAYEGTATDRHAIRMREIHLKFDTRARELASKAAKHLPKKDQGGKGKKVAK